MTDKKLMVYLENSQTAIPVTYKLRMLLRRAILETLAYENVDIKSPEVSMTFTDNEGIRELNQRFRGIDRSTDVLSFPLFDFEGGEEPPVDELVGMLGDIVISLETAQAQAEEYGHSFAREVAFLCVHSMLHLLGYDHETGEEDEAEMRQKQTAIMEIMGLAV
jgi:probable rRNA maturation factor